MPNEQQNQSQSTQKASPANQDNAGKVGFSNDKAKPIADKNAKDGACSTSGAKSSTA